MAKGKKTGGRVKGTPNKAGREIKAFTLAWLSSPAYVANAKKRVLQGKAPHLEILWHHYAFGKPKDIVQFDGPIPPFVLKLDGGE